MGQVQVFSNLPVKASCMIGTDVVNPKGDDLGDIKEVVIDPHTGKVAYAVVSFGGFLSMGEKLFAIPFSAFKYDVAENEYVLDVSKERLEARPDSTRITGLQWPKRNGTAMCINTTNVRRIGLDKKAPRYIRAFLLSYPIFFLFATAHTVSGILRILNEVAFLFVVRLFVPQLSEDFMSLAASDRCQEVYDRQSFRYQANRSSNHG